MLTCKATIQEGVRRGNSCQFPPSENGYCGRHQRNKIYDEGIEKGDKWCRYFFRGCNTLLRKDEVSCKECKLKYSKKQYNCKHEGCSFKVKEEGFCKKHERDKYRLEEQEKGIRYCDIARGCFTICKEGLASCDSCLEKARVKDKNRYNKRKEISSAIRSTTSLRICSYCGKDFEGFMTRYGKESVSCKECSEKQKKEDEKRVDRVRNYKEEMCKNMQTAFKEYIKSATKKGRQMNLDYNTFTSLITGPCYYCGYKKEGEVNGIDRVDNSKDYCTENCVSCCSLCNMMKSYYHPDYFIDKCKVIAKLKSVDTNFYRTWEIYYSRSSHKRFYTYKGEAEKRGLSFELSEEQWLNLVHSPCYLCGYQNKNGIGIDRFNNIIRSYTLINCRPCCGSCNFMKKDISYEQLLNQCEKIAITWPLDKNFAHIHIPPNPYKVKTSINKEKEEKERKVWKALGLYYALLSGAAESFYESYKDVYEEDEFELLCKEIHSYTKEYALTKLKTLLQTLKKRKQRAASRVSQSHHLNSTDSDTLCG